MRDGKVVEQGSAQRIFEAPEAAYTQALMRAAFDMEAAEGAIAVCFLPFSKDLVSPVPLVIKTDINRGDAWPHPLPAHYPQMKTHLRPSDGEPGAHASAMEGQ